MTPEKKQKPARLGKGLSALIGEYETASDQPELEEALRELEPFVIDIALIGANPNQPRKTFSEQDLDELTDSIRTRGVIQPILVRPHEAGARKYQIIAGERRWRAAKKAGLNQIPAVVRDFDDLEILEIGLIENIQRADLNPIEEAEGFHTLITRFGKTQESLAHSLGKSRAHIANAVRLLKLPENALRHVRGGEVSAGHARAALGAPDPEAIIDAVLAKGLSVRETEKLAKRAREEEGGETPTRPVSRSANEKDVDTKALEADLERSIGLAVDIRTTGKGGELRVRYGSLEQLDDLCRRLTR